MKMKSLIIEDNASVRETLICMLQEFFDTQIEVIGEADSVKTGIEQITILKPQLVFLDIDLRIGTGFDILSRFPQPAPFEVIFVTDYKEYAVRAFEVAAVGFVPKPISLELLEKYINRAYERLSLNEVGKSAQVLLENHKKNEQEQMITLPRRDKRLAFVRISDIIYCQAMEKESFIITTQKETIATLRGLGKLEELLGKLDFHRIHNSFLVNRNYIKEYDTENQKVQMSNGQRLEVSDRKRNAFLQSFQMNK